MQPESKTSAPALEFRNVTLAAVPLEHAGILRMSLKLMRGTLSVIRLESGADPSPLPDLAEGMIQPSGGSVLLNGEDFASVPAHRSLAMRGCVGRVFEAHGWISNLNVRENATLSQRHHTRRGVAEILDEAREISRIFGLRDLPETRPFLIPHGDLKRYEWVRAFLGDPILVILEHPMSGVPQEFRASLLEAARLSCARGAAVLWLDGDAPFDGGRFQLPIAEYAMRKGELSHFREIQPNTLKPGEL